MYEYNWDWVNADVHLYDDIIADIRDAYICIPVFLKEKRISLFYTKLYTAYGFSS